MRLCYTAVAQHCQAEGTDLCRVCWCLTLCWAYKTSYLSPDHHGCPRPLFAQVTVSTVGLVDKLEVFASNPAAPHLALSLHATTDEVSDAEPPVCT